MVAALFGAVLCPGSIHPAAGADPRPAQQLWAQRYGRTNGFDSATSLGVSPDGSKVCVTGYSVGAASADDYTTFAYDAFTGSQLWAARYKQRRPQCHRGEPRRIKGVRDRDQLRYDGLVRLRHGSLRRLHGVVHSTAVDESTSGSDQWRRARSEIDPQRVGDRIVAHSGPEFTQISGKRFTFAAYGRTIYLNATNRMISRTVVERALERIPLSSTVDVRPLSAPSYLFAILTDTRIRFGEW
jgi:hypothetical protein